MFEAGLIGFLGAGLGIVLIHGLIAVLAPILLGAVIVNTPYAGVVMPLQRGSCDPNHNL